GVFKRQVGTVQAVSDISFEVKAGETLGLVGESGCGKSTTGRSVIRLLDPTSGSVKFKGTELATGSKKQVRDFRREVQMVFQDPYASLNPRMTVRDIVSEPMRVFGTHSGNERNRRVDSLLDRVGLR